MRGLNKHIHLSEAELRQYCHAEQTLSQVQVEHIELELRVCEACQDRYINVLENSDFLAVPLLERTQYEKVIDKIEQENQKNVVPMKKKWYENSLLHITVAASITGLLFVSGFLSVMTNLMISDEIDKGVKIEFSNNASWIDLSEIEWFKQLEEKLTNVEKLINFKEE